MATPRYIDANKILYRNVGNRFMADREEINQMIPADVAPVAHAHFKIGDDGFIRCSLCQKDIRYPIVSFSDIDYCPRCGAKIDKEKVDPPAWAR